jgi:hypothetical protein
MLRFLAPGCLVLSFCITATAAARVTVDHFEPLTDLIMAAPAASPAASKATNAGRAALELSFTALGRSFRTELEPNARLVPLEQKLTLPPGVAAYRGTLAGQPGSWVRVVLAGGKPMGLIWDGQTLFALEAPFDSAAPSNDTIIYRLADLNIEPGTLQCGAGDAVTNGAQAFALIVSETVQTLAAQGATLNLDLGAVADYEFSQTFGTNAQTALLTRFNNVDGIFSSQLGVQITVAPEALTIFTADNDPFTATASDALLDELAFYRGGSPVQYAQGLTHLFTGRDLDGTTIGIAYIGSVCLQRSGSGRSYAAGLSQASGSATLDSLVAAHEIGHNFGAPHDAEAGSPCESTPGTFLMAPSINGNDQFSPCSIAQMQPVIDSATCLSPIGAADVTVDAANPGRSVAAGAAFDYALTVSNLGVDTATTVSTAIALDPGLEVQNATSPSGSCTRSLQAADCALGDVPGGAARTVTLTLRATAPGSFALAAAVTADQDADLGNNDWNDTVTAEANVDLGLAGTAPAVTLDQAKDVAITVTNNADFAATNVNVASSSGAGLIIDAATFAGGACTVSMHDASCQLTSLGPRQSATLVMTVTGIAAGQQSLSTQASSTETEVNAADNTLALSVNVAAAAAPSASSSSGGGGAAGDFIALLLPLWLARRRLRTRASARTMPRTP